MWRDDPSKGNGKYNTASYFVGSCTSTINNPTDTNFLFDANVMAALGHIVTQTLSTSLLVCSMDQFGNIWAISVSSLKGGGTWCVDSSGWAKPGYATIFNPGVCDSPQ